MRSARLLQGVLLIAGLLLAPATAWADDAHKPPDKFKGVGHDKDGKEKEFVGMSADVAAERLRKGEITHVEPDEPVNILAIQWDLGLWTVVVFLLLLFILSKVVWKPMLEGLHRREENIKAAIEESKAARAEAQHLREHLASERAKIAEEVRKALDEAREDGRRLVEEMQTKSRNEIQAERDRLRREISMARDQAIQELWTQAAQLATLISMKAVRRSLSADLHRELVDEALEELKLVGGEKK